MPKNSANKQYLRIQNSSLLNDVKDSAGEIIFAQNPSLPQPPPNYLSINFCFNYTFNNSAFTETKTGTTTSSGFTYYNLTHGVVWSNGVNWYWTDSLGVIPTGSTRYATMNNAAKPLPNSLGYSWVRFSGASTGTSMTYSVKGICAGGIPPTPTPSIASSPGPTPSVTATPTPTPSPSV